MGESQEQTEPVLASSASESCLCEREELPRTPREPCGCAFPAPTGGQKSISLLQTHLPTGSRKCDGDGDANGACCGHQYVSVAHLQCPCGLSQPWVPGAQPAQKGWEKKGGKFRWGQGCVPSAREVSQGSEGGITSGLGLRVLDGGRNLLSHLSEG